VTQFYSIDAANDRLADVRDLLERLRAQRGELVELRDRAAERLAIVRASDAGETGRRSGSSSERAGTETETDEEAETAAAFASDPELRAIRMRMQGLVDQMQAAVGRLDEWDVVLRDIQTGLIDFPALAAGRQVWLCWRLGEGGIEWWHELEAGVAGRKRLAELT
jgi:hypothetical protein